MTTDRRIKRTRDALSNALITLIKTTPLKKISIHSVVDIANVSRSTFYVHFDDIFDLYEQTINELLAGLADRMDADYPSPQENNFAVLTKDFIAYIEAHKEAFVTLTRAQNTDFLNRFTPFFVEKVLTLERLDRNNPSEYYGVTYSVTGTIGVITQWLHNGAQTGNPDISNILQNIFEQY
ncbi:TetR/AcrR family transcriptional regulator [Weissella cibaria]